MLISPWQPLKDDGATDDHLPGNNIPGSIPIASAWNFIAPCTRHGDEKREMGILALDDNERVVQLWVDLELGEIKLG